MDAKEKTLKLTHEQQTAIVEQYLLLLEDPLTQRE